MVRYRRLTIPFRILTFSVLLTLFWQALSIVFAVRYRNNAFTYHFECLTAYIFYTLTYFYLFRSRTIKAGLLATLISVFVLFLINILFIQRPADKQFPTYIYLLTNGLYVIFALLLYKQMLQYPLNLNIVRQSSFWFNTAIIAFSTLMFINLGFLNYYALHNWGKDIIYYFWNGNLYLFNILICVSLLTDNKNNSVQYG